MIQSPDEITKGWLENILKCQLAFVEVRENPAFNSSIVHLQLTYIGETALPHNVLVKLNARHDGQNEVQFYRFAKNSYPAVLPQVLEMEYDPQSGSSFVLLEDISNTHIPPISREQLKSLNGVPSEGQLESIVDSIAQFHAAFWEHPQFGSIPDTTEMRWWYRDETSHQKHLERRRNEWATFLERYKSEVPMEWITIGETALGKLPRLFESRIKPRLDSRQSLTMSQGDCYLTQFLVPRNGTGTAFLVDFQDACVNFPTYDLVYMFATFWTRDQRLHYEENLLRKYQEKLAMHGIHYKWEQLCDDYRLCLSYMLFDAVWNATSGSSREYWMPKLTCLIEAYQGWGCEQM